MMIAMSMKTSAAMCMVLSCLVEPGSAPLG
jgi:hypothetical protein